MSSNIKMKPFFEGIYLQELLTQCEYAIAAIELMNTSLRPNPDVFGTGTFFRDAHSFLSHASAISRILWPSGKDKKRAILRAEYLRERLGVGDAHTLKDRALRDHLEHFDARLDDWVESARNFIFVDRIIGPLEAIGGGVVARDIFRHFDPHTKTFTFRGHVFDIQKMADGIMDVQ